MTVKLIKPEAGAKARHSSIPLFRHSAKPSPDVLTTIKSVASLVVEVIMLQFGKLDLAWPAPKLMLSMLAALAEMERDLLVERTQSGLMRAKAEGKTLGRPTKTNNDQRAEIVNMRKTGISISALSRTYGISRASVMRVTDDL